MQHAPSSGKFPTMPREFGFNRRRTHSGEK
jgi:hypothetical protein